VKDGELRLGLIGAGRWGRIYIKTLKEIPGVRLARLASSNPDSSGLVADNCQITPDWTAVAEATDLDGVIIATPPDLHAEMTRAAIEAGNPVLIEKPLTMDVGEARDLLGLAEQSGAIAHVDHIHLYHPAWRELKRIGLGLGAIHEIRSAGGDWGPFRKDTPPLWDWASHDVALCLDLMGEMPETIAAKIRETRETENGPGETIAIKLAFPGGVTANIEVGNLMKKKKRFIAVHYDRQTLIYDDQADNPLMLEPRPDDAKCDPPSAEVIDVAPKLPLVQVIKDFAAAIRKGEPDIGGLRLGVQVVEVLGEAESLCR